MATQLECKLTLESLVNEYKSYFYQKIDETTVNQEGKIVYGYSETLLNNITKVGDVYSQTETYSRGDIVSYLGNIYVCKLDATTNKEPTNDFYWEIKITEKDIRSVGFNIRAYAVLHDGVIVDSVNINTVTSVLNKSDGSYNYRFDFLENLNNDRYTVLIENADLTDPELGSDLVANHNIKNKNIDAVYFRFDGNSTHYKKFKFIIIEQA